MYIAFLIVAVLLLLLVGKFLFRPDSSKSATLMNTYRRLTAETLSALPDEELVTAVVSNLLKKAEDERRDPYLVIPKLSTERCAVYSIWLLAKELEKGDPAALRQSGQFGFTELAADGLEFLDCAAVATMVREYLQTAEETLTAEIADALKEHNVNQRLVELIRADYTVFCDE